MDFSLLKPIWRALLALILWFFCFNLKKKKKKTRIFWFCKNQKGNSLKNEKVASLGICTGTVILHKIAVTPLSIIWVINCPGQLPTTHIFVKVNYQLSFFSFHNANLNIWYGFITAYHSNKIILFHYFRSRTVVSGAAWRRSLHQKYAGREREKRRGGKKEEREEREIERERERHWHTQGF